MKFTELHLVEELQKGIAEAGFVECTPVQEQTFKETLQGHDVLVQSQTGTGKTAAFLITLFQLFATTRDRRRRALVVVPTRELAVQVEDEASLLGTYFTYAIGSIYGGVGYGKQERLLQDGVDILVGTPGRLLDFASSGKLRFGAFDILVIDEADRMFDMGFYPDLKRILKELPAPSERLTMLFSATLSTNVRNVAWEHMNSPVHIEIAPEHITVEEITQELYHVPSADKLRLMLGVLKKEQPKNALIFTNTKHMAVELSERLSRNGFPSRFIMGDLPQRQRLQLIDGLKSGAIKFLVATDVAARGLHIDNLDLVVNYDVPEDFELYVHRIGRTARAGKSGKAITFACEQYVYGLPAIESYIGMKIPVQWADDGMYVDDVAAGVNLRRELGLYDERGGRGKTQQGGGRRSSGRPASAGKANGHPPPRSKQPDPLAKPRPERRPADRPRGRGGRRPEGLIHSPEHADLLAAQRDFAFKNAEEGLPPAERPSQPRSQAPGTGRREPGAPKGDKPRPQGAGKAREAAKPASSTPLEDRIAYYRAKYGEDFKTPGEPPVAGQAARPAPRRDQAGQPKRREPSGPKAPKHREQQAAQPARASAGRTDADRRRREPPKGADRSPNAPRQPRANLPQGGLAGLNGGAQPPKAPSLADKIKGLFKKK